MEKSIQNTEAKIKDVLLRTFISVLCCAIVGFIWYRGDLFNRPLHHFDFIAFGIIASSFFHTVRYTVRNSIAVLLSAALIVTVLMEQAHGNYAFSIIMNTGASAAAMYIYSVYVYEPHGTKKLVEVLNLSLLFGAANFFATLLVALLFGDHHRISGFWMLQWFRHWFLIGLGIGIGVALTDEPMAEKLSASYRNFIDWITSSQSTS